MYMSYSNCAVYTVSCAVIPIVDVTRGLTKAETHRMMRGELQPAQYVESKLRALATFPEHKAKALAALALVQSAGEAATSKPAAKTAAKKDVKTDAKADANTALASAPAPLRQTVALAGGASVPEDLYDADMHPMDVASVSFEHLPEIRRKDPKAAKTAQKAPAGKAAAAPAAKK